MDKGTKPCAHCKTAPRGSVHPSYCDECHRFLAARSRARRVERIRAGLDTRPCARCKVAPRVGTQSYCSDCLRALEAASRERVRQQPCARCKVGSRDGSGKYCADCWVLLRGEYSARQRTKVDLRKCSRCKVAPRNSSLKSYCVDCKRALHRESMQRTGGKKKLANCSRCGKVRTGAHPSYCPACVKLYREERRERECAKCGKPRSPGEQRSSVYCNDCARDDWLMRKYGITNAEYKQRFAAQGGACALCGVKCDEDGPLMPVDHCHATGKVRDLLCLQCNVGLGNLREDAALLRKAAEYLEAHASP